jgi:hypothetical protein
MESTRAFLKITFVVAEFVSDPISSFVEGSRRVFAAV